MTTQALEVTQHLKAGDTQTTVFDSPHRRLQTIGVPHHITCREHDLTKTRLANGFEFGFEWPRQRDGVHPEVVHGSLKLAHVRPLRCEPTQSSASPTKCA
jgi:hypothetical protein